VNSLPISTDDSPPFVLELIYRLKIKDVMTTTLVTSRRSDSLRDIQAQMKKHSITGVPVTEGNRLLGMVSMDDIIRALDAGYIQRRAEEYMTRNLIVLEDDMPLSFGISYLEKYSFGRFPVLNKEKELVGILTSRDVIVALLIEINKEAEKLEREFSAQREESHPDGIRREFATRKFDFENAGKPSSEIKRLLKERHLDGKLIRRVAVAAYELEMNQVVHSVGGKLLFTLDRERIVITATDQGPGIPDIDQAMTEGYSTATEWVRSLGFGAGMGLPNAKRVSDSFSVESSTHGTVVTATIFIHGTESQRNTNDHI